MLSNFLLAASVPSDSLQIMNTPPGLSTRKTCLKHFSNPGQK